MPTYANINPSAPTGSTPYCSLHLIPTTESDLADANLNFDPEPMIYGQNVSSVLEFLSVGTVSVITTCYVVLQTDWGDGNWIDVAWTNIASIPSTTVPTVVTLFAGVNLSPSGFAQARAVGTAPAGTAGNAIMLGSRFRFVGKCVVTGSGGPGINVTILHRELGLR